ncbi:MAG TPA: serine O-acetyltransferase [Candidatus Hydrogenedentes bacterium]|nr:serine O-acetyltransferase [Candidatus Hydrogenedentota bacterium]HNT87535.1 serine O-acetyltransferase [Candidatus Hydrogenedentota bacterium]
MSQEQADPIWAAIRAEAVEDARIEPMLASFLHSVVLNHKTLEDALSFQLAGKLESHTLTAVTLRDLIDEAIQNDAGIREAFRADILAVLERDPACTKYSTPLLYLKGFHALQGYRVAHYYWNHDRKPLARFLQSRISEVFGVDIHPAARVGKGILIDHATSVVIGETAVVADNVSMLHEVTLGGTGKESGDRHPKIGEGVLISSGAKILGNVTVGEGAKIGSCAVVLMDVEPHTTVVGVPAKPIGGVLHGQPALEMDHRIWLNSENKE